jgi:hypothetical protein
MNVHDYAHGSRKKSLNLSVNKDLVNAAKAKNIKLSLFFESKLSELLNNEIKSCGGRDSNTRTPTRQGPKPCAFSNLSNPRVSRYFTF